MALLRTLFALVVLALTFSAALPTTDDYSQQQSVQQPASTCTNPLKRKEWRMLKDNEKKDYIRAVNCLQRIRSKANPRDFPGAKSRYDDFISTHITHSRGLIEKTGGIHLVGHFLPWHRYFMITYEKALREECGYKGAQPYWNWTLDAGPGKNIRDSPIFDPVTGFGGDGIPGALPPNTSTRIDLPGGSGGGCVANGPFVNFTLNVGPGDILTSNPRCLSRSINPTMTVWLDSSNVAPLAEAASFEQFDFITQSTQIRKDGVPAMTFHGAGHFLIGAEASDIYSSNCEPIFYLHHTYIDSLWQAWQLANPSRFSEIGGPQKPFTAGPNVTLDFPIDLEPVGRSIPIRKVMNIMKGNTGGIGCYEYEW